VGAWIARECDIDYQTRSGLIALLHRLDIEHRKPKAISRKLDPAKQAAFIAGYEALMNRIEADEAVVFADAVHPTHAVRPVGCWGPKDVRVAVEQSSGRDRLNIHGAIDLETGNTRMLEVVTVNAISTIMLLQAIEAMYPRLQLIHVFLDNAKYHHAKLVQTWLARPGCRIKLHFIPTYCPHLDSIERLWGLMHKHITHNECYETFAGFKTAVLTFLREEVPKKWHIYCDTVTDNFRVIDPKDFRVLA
jgi:transposase